MPGEETLLLLLDEEEGEERDDSEEAGLEASSLMALSAPGERTSSSPSGDLSSSASGLREPAGAICLWRGGGEVGWVSKINRGGGTPRRRRGGGDGGPSLLSDLCLWVGVERGEKSIVSLVPRMPHLPRCVLVPVPCKCPDHV